LRKIIHTRKSCARFGDREREGTGGTISPRGKGIARRNIHHGAEKNNNIGGGLSIKGVKKEKKKTKGNEIRGRVTE